jgi:hypothetical protein
MALGYESDPADKVTTKVLAIDLPLNGHSAQTEIANSLGAEVELRDDCTEFIIPDNRQFTDERRLRPNREIFRIARDGIKHFTHRRAKVITPKPVELTGPESVFEHLNNVA